MPKKDEIKSTALNLFNAGVALNSEQILEQHKKAATMFKAVLIISEIPDVEINEEEKGVVYGNLGGTYKKLAELDRFKEGKEKYCEKALHYLEEANNRVKKDLNKTVTSKLIDSVKRIKENDAPIMKKVSAKTDELGNNQLDLVALSNTFDLAQIAEENARAESASVKAQIAYKQAITLFKATAILSPTTDVLKRVAENYINLAKLYNTANIAGLNKSIETYEKTGPYFEKLKIIDDQNLEGWQELENGMMENYKKLIGYSANQLEAPNSESLEIAGSILDDHTDSVYN